MNKPDPYIYPIMAALSALDDACLEHGLCTKNLESADKEVYKCLNALAALRSEHEKSRDPK